MEVELTELSLVDQKGFTSPLIIKSIIIVLLSWFVPVPVKTNHVFLYLNILTFLWIFRINTSLVNLYKEKSVQQLHVNAPFSPLPLSFIMFIINLLCRFKSESSPPCERLTWIMLLLHGNPLIAAFPLRRIGFGPRCWCSWIC